MPLDELLMERFKVKTRAVENPEGITVALTTAQKILANNPNRFAFIITNLGGTACYLGLTDQVADQAGIRLDASGGSFSCIWDEDFQMTGWAWWVIGVTGDEQLYSLEVVEY